MLFNSLTYVLFLGLLVPMVSLGPNWLRRGALLTGSLAFYAFWRLDFMFLVIFSALVDYGASIGISRASTLARRRVFLAISLCTNLGLLVVFKYTFFIASAVGDLAGLAGGGFSLDLPTIILPLGISFYTFQTISYTMDVYRGVQTPIRDFSLFLTYVMFWPQLVAGPILRAHEVVPQLSALRRPKGSQVALGLEEILRGLFKKVVLADSIAVVVDAGFGAPAAQLGTLDAWTLAFAFGFQIYFDFSGYSEIAIGSARLVGLNFPRNFNWPYLAVSPRDFWQRWHISLSSWIRDYLYLPLQGVKFRSSSEGGLAANAPVNASEARKSTALWATWAIMGLWHGANWTFLAWGLWHAVFVWLFRRTLGIRSALPAGVRTYGGWAFTLSVAMLGWLWFRAPTVGEAAELLGLALNPMRLGTLGLRENTYLLTFLYMAGLLTVAGYRRLDSVRPLPPPVRVAMRAGAYSVMMFWVYLLLRPVTQFIYFQF